MSKRRSILVPIDFESPSKRACDYALELAADLGAKLTLLHVIERFDIPMTAREHATVSAAAKEALERDARLIRPYVQELETKVVNGLAWEGIDAVARESGADLIVMGTHGRRGVARALLGSVTARVVRTSGVPVLTLPAYVARSRNDAGERLAAELEKHDLVQPNVIALSRGALTVATSIATRLKGSIDLWAVEPVVTAHGVVIGAVDEGGSIVLDPAPAVATSARDEAITSARERLQAELSALKGARSIGECWRLDVVLVADGLFDEEVARVAIDSIRKLGPKRIVLAGPIIARDVIAKLEGKVDAIVALERATVADACVYRDDVVATDLVAYELLLGATAQAPRFARCPDPTG